MLHRTMKDMETHFECLPPEGVLHATDLQGAIVVVEDPYIQKYLRNILGRHGYRVVESNANALTGMLRLGTEQIDLLITNSPREFLAFADMLPLIYMAGAPDSELASRFSRCRILRKPFLPEHLLEAVRDLIGSV